MYSSLVRLQNVFGFFSTVVTTLAVVIAFSSYLSTQKPTASLEMNSIRVVKGRPHYFTSRRQEYAQIRFDLEADLTSLFNWNTKQVFIYVKASFPSSRPIKYSSSSSISSSNQFFDHDKINEAVIWDAVVPSSVAPFHKTQWVSPSSRKSQNKNKRKNPSSNTKADSYQPGLISLSAQRSKYHLTDPNLGKIASRPNVTLHLEWNVQPWIGPLSWRLGNNFGAWKALNGGVSQPFTLPALETL